MPAWPAYGKCDNRNRPETKRNDGLKGRLSGFFPPPKPDRLAAKVPLAGWSRK